jgi:hypothetical protein
MSVLLRDHSSKHLPATTSKRCLFGASAPHTAVTFPTFTPPQRANDTKKLFGSAGERILFFLPDEIPAGQQAIYFAQTAKSIVDLLDRFDNGKTLIQSGRGRTGYLSD